MQEGLQPLSAVLRASKSGRVKRDEDKLWIPSSLRLFALPRYIYIRLFEPFFLRVMDGPTR